jgi:hypothetical protein
MRGSGGVTMTRDERAGLIERYAAGPSRLREALARVPAEAMRWRPAPDEWSVHEIVVHCGDSETASASRIRYVLAEDRPHIIGYDQDAWVTRLDYHALPVGPALAAAEAVRANTTALLRTLPDDAWERAGTHSESGAYSADAWLRIYAIHLHDHADQIEANLDAWRRRHGT